jgi:Na+/H+ antiporter NhaA
MYIEIEFPETLEEITVWALENAGDNTISYFIRLYREYNREMTSGQVATQVRAWLERIAPLGGIVTHQPLHSSNSNADHQVSVAGVFVCVMMTNEMSETLGEHA